jgi:UDP-N-acetylmuramoyl-tripeptide--D-alanyl-D-alanine ligase
MIENLKKALYFYVASYFRFFARIRLKRWNPKIIVVTGSNGKTTLLHMLEAQLGSHAKVSHHANSAFGVAFDILDLHRKTLQTSEWVSLFLNAPRNVFRPLPKEKIYVVEADADRPFEGVFLATLLQPEVVLWVSTGRTHSMNFDQLVSDGEFATVEEAIAYEYGYFLKYCKELAVIDGDSKLESDQVSRAKAKVKTITQKVYLKKYSVTKGGTEFHIKDKHYAFNGLLPKEIFLSIAMCEEAMNHLGVPFDSNFIHFQLPEGRGSLLNGIKDTVLIDSSYNGNLGSIKAMLQMFDAYPAKKKWVVLGDMKELGKEEREEHEALAKILNKMDLERVVLVGKAITKYTLPLIDQKTHAPGFEKASQAISYLQEHIKGGEAILFKGSQSIYLEGLIERLLEDKKDTNRLPRQTEFWKNQRKKLGF